MVVIIIMKYFMIAEKAFVVDLNKMHKLTIIYVY